ncbi:hypothetical protein RB195_023865 [Necator americanus]|uniref:Protein kinase domain-containing protein n=1 Tax=Necator americanus TaxID=51031 RepID=A0ABR1EL27_NECAM
MKKTRIRVFFVFCRRISDPTVFGRDMSLGFGDIQEGNNLPCRRGYSVDMLYQELMVSSGLLTIGGKTRRVAVEDLHFVAELGQGSCGHVSKMQYNDNVMAVKVMPRSNNPVENNRIIMDLRILSRAYDCPHIVHSYGYIITEARQRSRGEYQTVQSKGSNKRLEEIHIILIPA